MTHVIALDPGPVQSALVTLFRGDISTRDILENHDVLHYLKCNTADTVVCEEIVSFGMPVGREVFDTVRWTGRFQQVFNGDEFAWITRREVKLHLCNSSRAKDANVRAALLDRFGGKEATRKGGALHGFKRDLWSALGVLVTWCDRNSVEVLT